MGFEEGLNELALFAGAGGGILGGHLLGWRTVCAVEKAPYRREVLLRRQRDGVLPVFPIWDDVRTFDGEPWSGLVDVVSAGFPCQPFSVAGKQRGADDERNGWPDTIRIIRQVQPRFAFLENVPGLLSSGYFGRVLGDLAEAGYDAVWTVLGADDAGAPHRRKRLWILGYTNGSSQDTHTAQGGPRSTVSESNIGAADLAYPQSGEDLCGDPGVVGGPTAGWEGCDPATWACGYDGQVYWWGTDPADLPDTDEAEPDRLPSGKTQEHASTCDSGGNGADADKQGLEIREGSKAETWTCPPVTRGNGWPTQSRVGRLAHGVAHRVDRLSALGDGQVPAVAAAAWTLLNKTMREAS